MHTLRLPVSSGFFAFKLILLHLIILEQIKDPSQPNYNPAYCQVVARQLVQCAGARINL